MITFKVPKQVQVGGHIYHIALSQNLKDSDSNAITNNRLQIIVINAERPESQKVEGLLHEIIHVVNNIYLSRCLEESTIDSISEGLFQVFSQLGVKLDWSEIPVKEYIMP